MSYRPKNWDAQWVIPVPKVDTRTDLIEAGADAILEALKAEGLAIKVEDENTIDDIAVMSWLDDKLDKTPEGTLVFIPKE